MSSLAHGVDNALLQRGEQRVARKGLADVGRGFAPERSQDVVRRVLDGHHDHRNCRMAGAESAEKRQAVHARHEDVDEQKVVGMGFQMRQRFFAAGGAVGFPAAPASMACDEFVNGRIVIHDQEPVWLRGWHLGSLR